MTIQQNREFEWDYNIPTAYKKANTPQFYWNRTLATIFNRIGAMIYQNMDIESHTSSSYNYIDVNVPYKFKTLIDYIVMDGLINNSKFTISYVIASDDYIRINNFKIKILNFNPPYNPETELVIMEKKEEEKPVAKLIKGRRYNKGKLRYELLPAGALEEIAKIYTNGADKYTDYDENSNITYDGSRDWRKGLSWMDCIASTKRHIEKFVKGADIDNETNTLHLANACWNLMAILEFYRIFPQGDDRIKNFLNPPKIGLDIDGVLADFSGSWNKLYPEIPAKHTSWYSDRKMKDRFDEMRNNGTLDSFYLDIEPLIVSKDLPFEPSCYITSRPVSKKITEQWLDKHGFPAKPVYAVELQETKADVAKESGIDIFIDDSYANFADLNNNGIFTYLYSASWNTKYNVGHMRLDSLNELPFLK